MAVVALVIADISSLEADVLITVSFLTEPFSQTRLDQKGVATLNGKL